MKFSNRIFINLLFITFLFNNCANDLPKITEKDGVVYVQNSNKGLWNNSKRMVLSKIWTIGENNINEKYDFAAISDIIVDSNGNIYVCDSKDHCIKIYSAQGEYIKSIGKKGQGPGELLGPRYMGFGPDKKLFIYEPNNRRISTFNTTGEFISSFNYRMSEVASMAVDPQTGDVFLSELLGFVKTNKKFIQKYSMNGTFRRSFGEPFILGEATAGKQCLPIHMEFLSNGNLLCYAGFPYELRIYTTKGELLKKISKDSPYFSNPKTYSINRQSGPPFQFLINRGWLTKCLILPEDKILTRIDDFGENYFEKHIKRREAMQRGRRYDMKKSTFYDYFDSSGSYLQSFENPIKGGNIDLIDSKNNVFVSNKKDEIPIVEKYKLEFIEKD
jgi:hypothetical protein